MAKFNEENKRRESTKRRYNGVHDAYSLVMEELGDLADAVSRQLLSLPYFIINLFFDIYLKSNFCCRKFSAYHFL